MRGSAALKQDKRPVSAHGDVPTGLKYAVFAENTFFRLSVRLTLRFELFPSEQVVASNSEKIRQRHNIGCFGFVQTPLPIIDGLLAHADRLCQFCLRKISFLAQFFDNLTDSHMYIVEIFFSKTTQKKKTSC